MWSKGDIVMLVNPWEGCRVSTGSTAVVVESSVNRRDDWCALNWDDPANREHYIDGAVYGDTSKWFIKAGGPW